MTLVQRGLEYSGSDCGVLLSGSGLLFSCTIRQMLRSSHHREPLCDAGPGTWDLLDGGPTHHGCRPMCGNAGRDGGYPPTCPDRPPRGGLVRLRAADVVYVESPFLIMRGGDIR